MNHDFKHIIFYTILVLSVFVIIEIIYRVFKVKTEYTRKAAHILCGLITLSYPVIFDNHLPVLILNIESFLLLVLSKKFNFFQSINNVRRKTLGSYLYPISIYLVFVASLYFKNKFYFYIPILVLSISDPIAALAGLKYKFISKKFSKIKYVKIWKTEKTIVGSILFMLTTLLISLIIILFFIEVPILKTIFISFFIAIFSTIVEAYSKKGIDNLTIPLSVLFVLIIFNI